MDTLAMSCAEVIGKDMGRITSFCMIHMMTHRKCRAHFIGILLK